MLIAAFMPICTSVEELIAAVMLIYYAIDKLPQGS